MGLHHPSISVIIKISLLLLCSLENILFQMKLFNLPFLHLPS